MSIREQAIKGALWSVIQGWGSQAGALVVFFVLARLLSPEDFGLVALANVFLAFMQIFIEQGFSQAIVQRQTLEPAHLDTAFWTSIGVGVLLSSLCFAGAGVMASVFDQPQLAMVLRGFSPLFLINAFSGVQRSLLERQFDFKALASRTLLGTAVGGVVGVTLAFLGAGVWSLVGQQLSTEFAAVLVLWRFSDWRPKFQVSLHHFRELFEFGVNILAFNFFSFFNTRSDDFLIGYFLGTAPLGYYTIAYKILNVMTQLLVSSSNQVAFPTFSRLQDDLDQLRKAFFAATRITSAIAFPTFLGMAALAPQLVMVLFGEQWLPSVPLMQILSGAGLVRSISFFKGSVFMAMGKPSWRLWLSMLNALLKVVGFLIAVQFGVEAVAWSYVITTFIFFPIGQWAVSLLVKISLVQYFRQFFAPLLCSTIMAVMIVALRESINASVGSIFTLILGSALGAAAYICALRVVAPLLFQQLLSVAQTALRRPIQTSA